jgi:hypothetical protein
MKTLKELRTERENLLKPENVKAMDRVQRRNELRRLKLLDKAIQFLLCEPTEDFVKRQLAFIEKKIEAVKKHANDRVKAHGNPAISEAAKIRARVYKEEGLRKLHEQMAYVRFVLN